MLWQYGERVSSSRLTTHIVSVHETGMEEVLVGTGRGYPGPTDPEQYLLSRRRARDVTRATLAADCRLPGQRFPPVKKQVALPSSPNPPSPTKAKTRGKLKRRSSLTPNGGVTGSHVVP